MSAAGWDENKAHTAVSWFSCENQYVRITGELHHYEKSPSLEKIVQDCTACYGMHL